MSIKQNYYEFTSVLANTEFCKYLSISYNEIKSQNFECYYDVYNYICSKRLSFEGTQYWVEKSPENIVKISQLIDNYPSSKYIYIKRCIYDIVLSNLKKEKNLDKNYFLILKRIFRITFNCLLYDEIVNKYKDKFIFISFEDLIYNKNCKFLNSIGLRDFNVENPYKINSSFLENENKVYRFDIKVIIFFSHIFYFIIPSSILIQLKKLSLKKNTRVLWEYFYK